MSNRKTITLRCGSQGCCPRVTFTEDDTVEIRDDFGGLVKLTKEQWGLLQQIDPDREPAS